jgi:hypothetical protein
VISDCELLLGREGTASEAIRSQTTQLTGLTRTMILSGLEREPNQCLRLIASVSSGCNIVHRIFKEWCNVYKTAWTTVAVENRASCQSGGIKSVFSRFRKALFDRREK